MKRIYMNPCKECLVKAICKMNRNNKRYIGSIGSSLKEKMKEECRDIYLFNKKLSSHPKLKGILADGYSGRVINFIEIDSNYIKINEDDKEILITYK